MNLTSWQMHAMHFQNQKWRKHLLYSSHADRTVGATLWVRSNDKALIHDLFARGDSYHSRSAKGLHNLPLSSCRSSTGTDNAEHISNIRHICVLEKINFAKSSGYPFSKNWSCATSINRSDFPGTATNETFPGSHGVTQSASRFVSAMRRWEQLASSLFTSEEFPVPSITFSRKMAAFHGDANPTRR